MEKTVTQEQLERLLRGAEEAHAEYERQLGHADANWPAWYAQWIFEQLSTGKTAAL
jgi:hypothetical protein